MPLWVNRVGLAINPSLPVYPDERTSSDRPRQVPFRANKRHRTRTSPKKPPEGGFQIPPWVGATLRSTLPEHHSKRQVSAKQRAAASAPKN
jgi:hypothetical protein